MPSVPASVLNIKSVTRRNRNTVGFILNIPYTLLGLLAGIVSVPKTIAWRTKPYAIILKVRSLWWAIGYMKNARAMATGHVVLLGPRTEDKDLEHELIHVQQHQRTPLIQPFLYAIEVLKHGTSPRNKYEAEAYRIAGNVYRGE